MTDPRWALSWLAAFMVVVAMLTVAALLQEYLAARKERRK